MSRASFLVDLQWWNKKLRSFIEIQLEPTARMLFWDMGHNFDIKFVLCCSIFVTKRFVLVLAISWYKICQLLRSPLAADTPTITIKSQEWNFDSFHIPPPIRQKCSYGHSRTYSVYNSDQILWTTSWISYPISLTVMRHTLWDVMNLLRQTSCFEYLIWVECECFKLPFLFLCTYKWY